VLFSTGETELGLSDIEFCTAAIYFKERLLSLTPLTVIVVAYGEDPIVLKA